AHIIDFFRQCRALIGNSALKIFSPLAQRSIHGLGPRLLPLLFTLLLTLLFKAFFLLARLAPPHIEAIFRHQRLSHVHHHLTPVIYCTAPGCKLAHAHLTRSLTPINSCCSSERVGAATTLGVPTVPICAGVVSSKCTVAFFETSIWGAPS